MTKTISVLALLTSTSAFADLPPGDPNAPTPAVHKYCLESVRSRDGSRTASCDATEQNTEQHRRIKSNGCAKDQLALTIVGQPASIEACEPPGTVQL